jgi:hypothetical protein
MGSSNGKPIQQRLQDAAISASSGVTQLTAGLHTAAAQAQQLSAAGQQLGQAVSPMAKSAYDMAKQFHMAYGSGNGILGGYQGGFFGGDAEDATGKEAARELREYEYSIAAKTKDKVVRGLARAMQRAGVPVDPEADLESIAKALSAGIPNPRKGKSFSDDAKAQERVCRTVAQVLNDEFTPGATKAADKFIDTSLGAVSVCRQVGEWVHSFASGVTLEFLEVFASVKRVLRNLEVLEQVMDELYENIQRRIPEADKPGVGAEIDSFDEIYRLAKSARKRQEEELKNFLHVTLAPAQKELEIALRDESEAHELIQKLGLKPGTTEFADSLAMAISGIGTVAAVAQRVHGALKDVGMSINQYVESSDMAALNKALDEKMMSGSFKSGDMGKFLEAVQTLRRNFDRREELKKGFETLSSESSGAGQTGGAEEPSAIAKKMDRLKIEKKLLLKEFTDKTATFYKEIQSATKDLSSKLGKEIPITDKTDALRDAIERLRDQAAAGNLAKIELALTGLAINVESRERKERFVSALRHMSGTLSSLMELESYRGASTQFARLKAAVDGLEKTINYFSDLVAKKYGAGQEDETEYSGGDIGDYAAEIQTSALNLNEALADFIYFYYIAKVRENLSQTSKELAIYGEKYTDVLGDAVAARIRTLETERKTINDYLNNTTVPAGAVNPHPLVAAVNAAAAGAQLVAAKAALDGVKGFIKHEYDIKAKFYRVIQAVDLYMKAFTDAIARDPDAVRDIKKILDGTQVIARWFSEETGESLWKAFESMGCIDANGALNPGPSGVEGMHGEHYYQRVRGGPEGTPARDNIMQVGLPQAGVVAGSDQAKNAASQIDSMFDTFQALKNLINAFSRIGDKFGGRELRTQIFMSPTQIFKALMDYLKASTFSMFREANGGAPANPLQLPITPQAAGNLTQHLINVTQPFGIFFSSTFRMQTSTAGAGTWSDFRGNWAVEDRYFQLIIKSMASKILTVLGVYDMFERDTPLAALTPTRMIIGGADEADPEVHDEAAELYFRLPRLAEFYKNFLDWNGEGAALKIAMLPELEGVFSGLIRLIFQKMTATQSGDYSDTEVKAMIREINAIYENFRASGKDRAVTDALNALVREVNRRYGVIKSQDMKDYWKLVEEDRKFTATGPLNPTNYSILPGEDDYETDRRAPSDRWARGVPGTSTRDDFESKYKLDETDWFDPNAPEDNYKRLFDFRKRLEEQFDRVRPDQYGKISYGVMIKQVTLEIKRATSKEAKLALAMKLIQGSNIATLDSSKALMFHETVVVGLNTLSAVQSLLFRFSAMLDNLDFGEACEEIRLNGAGTAGAIAELANGAPFGGAAPTRAVLAAFVSDQYKDNSADFPHTGRRARVESYMLDADNVALRAGATADVTGTSIRTFLQAEAADARGAGLISVAAYNGILAAGGPAAAPVYRYEAAMGLSLRLLFDYPRAMRDFIENVYNLVGNGQGLIDLRYPGTPDLQLQLDFTKLVNFCSSMMSDVKFFMDQLRPFIDAAIIKRFEDLSNPGSVFWLEKNLMDRYFRGTGTIQVAQTLTVEALSRKTNRIFIYMLRDTYTQGAFPASPGARTALKEAVDAWLKAQPARAAGALSNGNLTAAAAARLAALAPPAAENERHETYGRTLSEIIWYDVGAVNAGANPVPGIPIINPDNYSLQQLIATDRALAHVLLGGGNAGRYGVYTDAKGLRPYRSMLFAFNQILAKYLGRLTDQGSGRKIYMNLINSFANGVASQAVSSPSTNAYPDLAADAVAAFGWRGDPKSSSIVFQSLAYILQRLVKDANPSSQLSDHLISTMADVPMYLKESYRANLPNFIKLFDSVVQKSDFIKQFIQKTTSSTVRLRLDRPSTAALASLRSGGVAIPNTTLIQLVGATYVAGDVNFQGIGQTLDTLDTGLTDSQMKTKVAALCDSLSAAAYTISNSAAEVRKELADHPVYLQVQEGSIETYKARYGKMPLMPISLALYFIHNVAGPGTNDDSLMPDHALGEPEFKLAYGVRGLLSGTGQPTYEQMPGVKTILDGYNGISASRDSIDAERYLSFVRRVVGGLRFIIDARNFRAMVSVCSSFDGGLFSLPNLVGGAQGINVTAVTAAGGRTAVYSIDKNAQEILNVIENSNQDDEIRMITDNVGGPSGALPTGNRQLELIYNLVDMNIVPINVHALMRDIPGVNLYNYSYTFEQMACLLYGESPQKLSKLTDNPAAPPATRTKDTRQMFLRLLADPYMPITKGMFGSDMLQAGTGGFVHRIFRGDNNLGMGRPKFLSDQVFNKALFGSIYPSQADYDEAGPPAGSAVARGRDNVNVRQAYQVALAVGRTLDGDVQGVRGILTPLIEEITASLAVLAAADGGAAGGVAAWVTAGVGAAGANPAAVAVNAQFANWAATLPATIAAGQAAIAAIINGIRGRISTLYANRRANILGWPGRARQIAQHAGSVRPAFGTSNLMGQLVAAADAAAGLFQVASAAATNPAAINAAFDGATNAFYIALDNAANNGIGQRLARDVLNAGTVNGVNNALTGPNYPVQMPGAAIANPAAPFWAQGTLPALSNTSSRLRTLTYLKRPVSIDGQEPEPDTAVVTVNVGTTASKDRLENVGIYRWNTRVVRNLFFITNVVRLIRLKLSRELTQNRNVIVNSHDAVSAGVTEYGVFNPNETLANREYSDQWSGFGMSGDSVMNPY